MARPLHPQVRPLVSPPAAALLPPPPRPRQAARVAQRPAQQVLHVAVDRSEVVRGPGLESRERLWIEPEEETHFGPHGTTGRRRHGPTLTPSAAPPPICTPR